MSDPGRAPVAVAHACPTHVLMPEEAWAATVGTMILERMSGDPHPEVRIKSLRCPLARTQHASDDIIVMALHVVRRRRTVQ
jgi:hypothetical protein